MINCMAKVLIYTSLEVHYIELNVINRCKVIKNEHKEQKIQLNIVNTYYIFNIDELMKALTYG